MLTIAIISRDVCVRYRDRYGGDYEAWTNIIKARRYKTMTKKIISSFLCAAMLFLLIGGPLEASAAVATKPASITNISYKYNDRVKFRDLSGVTYSGDSLKISGASLSAGDVIVDESGSKSLKILKVNKDGTYITARPTMYDLFSEFTIPRQIIEPNEANIIEYGVKGISAQEYASILASKSGASGTQKLMSGDVPSADMQKMYDLFESRDSRIYRFNGDYTFSSFNTGSGSSNVKLHLEGAVGVSPGIVADYSLFSGYEFGFVDAAQFIDLKALLDVKIDQEMYCPIFAISIPIPGLGAVRAGIYLVLDVDGDITLTVKAEEGIIASASVYGSTKYGIPTSFHLKKEFDPFFGAECDPMGYIHAGVYITPLVMLEILGVDVFDAQLRLGFYAYADFAETTMNYGVDFVIHAFVTILDDRTTLIRQHVPIIERSKTMRAQDDVIYYFSRLCSYQDRINVAAFTNRPTGSTELYSEPFSDKVPFANRTLEAWYYASGNDPQGGSNQNPTKIVTVTTDDNGGVSINFQKLGIDIAKGDTIVIKAPGFNGQTDLIQATTPFVSGGEFSGASNLQGDYFEDTVEFETLSGKDLTVLDVPNADVEFDTQQRIYYKGPVTVYSTDKTTKVTEKATFTAQKDVTQYGLKKTGLNILSLSGYDIKPNCELCWQITDSGYTYGTTVPSGKGGLETRHNIVVHRITTDQQVPIEDYEGSSIGLQHNITLQLIAVNKGGSKPYTGAADLYVALGEVPAGYKQGNFPPKDLGYVKFPAADVRYPNHFEYYRDNPFPVLLYEVKDLPKLILGSAISSNEGTSTEAGYRWRWEEIKPNIPSTVTVTETYTSQSPTGAPIRVREKVEVTNIIYTKPYFQILTGFTNMQPSYIITSPTAGASVPASEDEAVLRSIYQMRHIVSGMSVTGVPLPDPPFSPPAPVIYDFDELTQGTANAFNIEFQLEQMYKNDRFIVNPLSDWASGSYKTFALTGKNTAITAPATIKNAAALPAWAAGYIRSAVNNGIMRLDANGNFPVGKNTTRAEFCAAIVNALGLSSLDATKSDFTFKDIKSADPNFLQMQTAYQCGIISGVSAAEFRPNSLITRQDAASMLIRAFSLRNTGLIPADTGGKLGRFVDRNAVSSYATANLEKSVALDFFSGYPDGTLLPLKNITNEQTAKIIWELKLKAEKPGLEWAQ